MEVCRDIVVEEGREIVVTVVDEGREGAVEEDTAIAEEDMDIAAEGSMGEDIPDLASWEIEAAVQCTG